MRRVLLLFILIGLIGYGFSLEMNVEVPSEVGVNSTVSVRISLVGNADKADVGLLLPSGWELISWDVYGTPKYNVYLKYEELNGSKFPHFIFGNIVEGAQINAIIKPTSSGVIKFVSTYTKGGTSGFSFANKTLKVKEVVCGNGICENGENQKNCPVDCQVKTHAKYLSLIIVSGLIIGIIGYLVWRKRNVY